ncbi:hypothetical protein MWH28_05875 [Natroniella sulfidigena]|uniref:hypothetical protein n=1 Tax=Natroniella sulfidigena TaxID=723921 RepID=UPI00200A0C04|nr:hypothetical protein [Natroniella sulfidigena]MCK8816901.1 hypothetical protein [Natroniella sulfidigena]
MKKQFLVLLLVGLLFSSSGTAWALSGPTVRAEQGSMTAMLISDHGFSLGGEYGLNSEIGLTAKVGTSFDRLGVKYQLDSNLALLAGLADSDPFVGINGQQGLSNEVVGLYELNLTTRGGDLSLLYDVGVSTSLNHNLDLRAGFIGHLDDRSSINLQLGVGHRF